MPRKQVNFGLAPQVIQGTANPNRATEQFSYDTRLTSGQKLASALGALEPYANVWAKKQLEEEAEQKIKDQNEARALANSMPLSQLHEQINKGDMMPSQSPAFMATLHHIYGENSLKEEQRNFQDGLTTGELNFNNEQELEEHMVKQRNEFLKGKDEYTVAGYDKSYNQLKQSNLDFYSRKLNKENVDRGLLESETSVYNLLETLTDPSGDIKPTEGGNILGNRLKLLEQTSLINSPETLKVAINSLSKQITLKNNPELLESFLNQTDNNGVPFRSIIGNTKAQILEKTLEGNIDRARSEQVDIELLPHLRQATTGDLDNKGFLEWARANKKHLTSNSINAILNRNEGAVRQQQQALEKLRVDHQIQRSELEAQQNIKVAIESGSLAFLNNQKVLDKQGELKDFPQESFVKDYLTEKGKDLPLDAQVKLWETNGVSNPQWESIIQSGVGNISSVGWEQDGKPIGELNDQGKEAIQLYMDIQKISPVTASRLAGGKDDLLSDIQFMMEKGGIPNISEASTLINQGRLSGVTASDVDNMKGSVKSAVDDVLYPNFFSQPVNWFSNFFGNEDVNLTAVQSTIRRRSELLVQSGQISNAQQAVKATVEYLSNPQVTTLVNNTLYFNKDLPRVPEGEGQAEWFENFIDSVPREVARNKDLDEEDIRLEPNSTGGFTAWTGGVPLTYADNRIVQYSKDDVSKWIGEAHNSLIYERLESYRTPERQPLDTRRDRELLTDEELTLPFNIE